VSGQVDDPALSTRITERQQELAAKPAQELTVAERLTLRAMERRETLVVDSSGGEIEIEIRLPLAAEVREIEDLQNDAVRTATEIRRRTLRLIRLQDRPGGSSQEDFVAELTGAQEALEALQSRAAAANRQLLELIADICVDESITVKFLESGMFAPEDIGGIVQGVLKASQERAAEARSFRSK